MWWKASEEDANLVYIGCKDGILLFASLELVLGVLILLMLSILFLVSLTGIYECVCVCATPFYYDNIPVVSRFGRKPMHVKSL